MLVRRAVFEAVKGFDERFFLYMEDVDLSRRIGAISKLLYWPHETIVHGHAQGSYKDRRLLALHISSAIQYFKKWGWLRDGTRQERNLIGAECAIGSTAKQLKT